MLNEDELKDAALLVFANKQDQPGAKGAGEISEALRLGELRDRNWSIVACSAVDGRGVDEGMDWLVVSNSTSSITSWHLTRMIANGPAGVGRESWLFSLYHHSDEVWVDGLHTQYDMEKSMDFLVCSPGGFFSTRHGRRAGVRRMFELQ
jgi:hypothetical protein